MRQPCLVDPQPFFSAAQLARETLTYSLMIGGDAVPDRRLSIVADDDQVYTDYVESSIDPGNKLFVIAFFICFGSILGLPLFVKLGRWLEKCTKKNGVVDESGHDEHDEGRAFVARTSEDGVGLQPSESGDSNPTFLQRVLNHAVIKRRRRGAGAHAGEGAAVSRGLVREARASVYRHIQEDAAGLHQQEYTTEEDGAARLRRLGALMKEDAAGLDRQGTHVDIDGEGTVEVSLVNAGRRSLVENEDNDAQTPPSPEPTVESENKQHGIIRGQDDDLPPPTSTGRARESLLFMWKILKYDNETQRIVRLAVPFTISALIETTSDLVILIIISQYLGTDAMVAYAMVDVIVGISAEFMKGFIEAISSLGSMAFGAGNYELAGQYLQTSCILYAACEIPMAAVWRASIAKILLLMGFEGEVAVLAEDFVLVMVAMNIMAGLNECIADFLEVIELELYANIMGCAQTLVELGLVAVFAIKMDATLVILGLVMLVNEAFFFMLNIVVPNQMGWLSDFEVGIFGRCSLKNKSAVRELVKVAIPLAFGSLLAYAEWVRSSISFFLLPRSFTACSLAFTLVQEVLTIFAAALGPAEAVRVPRHMINYSSALC